MTLPVADMLRLKGKAHLTSKPSEEVGVREKVSEKINVLLSGLRRLLLSFGCPCEKDARHDYGVCEKESGDCRKVRIPILISPKCGEI